MSVSGSDLRRVFAFLETVPVGSPADPIPRGALRALRDLIRADHAEYFALRRSDAAVLALTTSHEIREAPGSDDALRAFSYQNPIGWRRWSVQHGAMRLSDHVGPRTLRGLEFYQEFMRPNGLRDSLKVWLASDDQSVACVQLWRYDGEFARGQRDLLAIVHQDLIRLRTAALTGMSPRAKADVPLTAREAEVLLWAVRGYSRAAIAALVGAEPRTVAKHLEHAYEKLDVRSRAEAADRILCGGPARSTTD